MSGSIAPKAVLSCGFAAALILSVAVASAQTAAPKTAKLPGNIRFCPTWAEAHERSLADLHGGRRPPGVRWKGCIAIEKGTEVEVVESDDQWTAVIYKGKRWFADEQVF